MFKKRDAENKLLKSEKQLQEARNKVLQLNKSKYEG